MTTVPGVPSVAAVIANHQEVYRRPIITLAGGGDEVTLDGVGRGYTLKPGSTGLGVAPFEITRAELPGGGAVMRHRRRAVREIFLPVDVHFGTGVDEYGDLEDARRRLEAICDGETGIHVEGKGGLRTATGYLTGGLGGDFATSAVNLTRMNLGLTFECYDPRFYGEQQVEEWKLAADRMPILSTMRDEPRMARLVRTNYVLNPSIVGTFGRAVFVGDEYQTAASSASTELPRFGTSSWRMEVTGSDGHKIGGRIDTAASGTIRYAAGLWMRPGPGVYSLNLEIQSDQSGSWRTTAVRTIRGTSPFLGSPIPQEWQQVTVEESSAQAGNRRLVFSFSREGAFTTGTTPPIESGSVSFVDGAMLVDATHSRTYFDGSTTVANHSTNWTGAPHESTSEQWTLPAGESDGIMGVPFGAMRLSESTVQGAAVLDIKGDANAEAVLMVTGPGDSLEVINETTGQRVFIDHPITETITIDARPRRRDIYSESRQNGEWWEWVSKDTSPSLITLKPGENRIRVVMIAADPNSVVRLLYRETFNAAH